MTSKLPPAKDNPYVDSHKEGNRQAAGLLLLELSGKISIQRKELGMSHEDLAAYAGVKLETVKQFMLWNGASDVRFSDVLKMITALDMKIDVEAIDREVVDKKEPRQP